MTRRHGPTGPQLSKRDFLTAALVTAATATTAAGAQPVPEGPVNTAWRPVPRDWIDADTGHRIVRLSNTDHTQSLYFNFPAYSPDGKWMVMNRPDGISLVDMETLMEKNLYTGNLAAFQTGASKRVVYARPRSADKDNKTQATNNIFTVDIDTGAVTQIAAVEKGFVTSVNADDTLLVGSYAYRDVPLQPGPKVAGTDGGYNAIGPDGKPMSFAAAKEYRMAQRLAAEVPMDIFTIDIRTGARKVLVHSTDWLNHMQFSPADPGLLMYCHEGPWHEVDRIWTIRTDGTGKQLMHKRAMNMEIAGHEFFNWDGSKLFYDLQTPRGEDFWLAYIDLKTGKRVWYHMERNEWSVHFNVSKDGALFAGDGGDADMVAHAPDGKYIYLFRPEIVEDLGVSAPNAADLVRPGVLRSEKLVNMKDHDYRLEPNLRFSPDGKWLIFHSNMHGPVHTYAVSVAKA